MTLQQKSWAWAGSFIAISVGLWIVVYALRDEGGPCGQGITYLVIGLPALIFTIVASVLSRQAIKGRALAKHVGDERQ